MLRGRCWEHKSNFVLEVWQGRSVGRFTYYTLQGGRNGRNFSEAGSRVPYLFRDPDDRPWLNLEGHQPDTLHPFTPLGIPYHTSTCPPSSDCVCLQKWRALIWFMARSWALPADSDGHGKSAGFSYLLIDRIIPTNFVNFLSP